MRSGSGRCIAAAVGVAGSHAMGTDVQRQPPTLLHRQPPASVGIAGSGRYGRRKLCLASPLSPARPPARMHAMHAMACMVKRSRRIIQRTVDDARLQRTAARAAGSTDLDDVLARDAQADVERDR